MKETIFQIINDPKFLLGFSANFFYIYAIWKSRNDLVPMKPVRITWIMFSILNLLILGNQVINGNTFAQLGLNIGYLLGAFLVFLISVPYGEWLEKNQEKTLRLEYYVLGISFLAGLLYVFTNGLISIIFLALALAIGAYPTIKKIWNNPQSEPGFPWIMWFVASSLAMYDLGRISQWTFGSAFIPCVYLGLNIPTAWAIGNRK